MDWVVLGSKSSSVGAILLCCRESAQQAARIRLRSVNPSPQKSCSLVKFTGLDVSPESKETYTTKTGSHQSPYKPENSFRGEGHSLKLPSLIDFGNPFPLPSPGVGRKVSLASQNPAVGRSIRNSASVSQRYLSKVWETGWWVLAWGMKALILCQWRWSTTEPQL